TTMEIDKTNNQQVDTLNSSKIVESNAQPSYSSILKKSLPQTTYQQAPKENEMEWTEQIQQQMTQQINTQFNTEKWSYDRIIKIETEEQLNKYWNKVEQTIKKAADTNILRTKIVPKTFYAFSQKVTKLHKALQKINATTDSTQQEVVICQAAAIDYQMQISTQEWPTTMKNLITALIYTTLIIPKKAKAKIVTNKDYFNMQADKVQTAPPT
ncbi:9162_t:CDS:2, partial [Racocetra fulgida]